MGEQCSEDKRKSPGLMLAKNITMLEGLFLGFWLSQHQTGNRPGEPQGRAAPLMGQMPPPCLGTRGQR